MLWLKRFAPFTGKKRQNMKVKWFVFSLVLTYWTIEQTLHGRLEVWNFSSAISKIILCISLDCKHSKRKFVPSSYHVISSMYLGHETKTHSYSSHQLPSEWQEAAVFCSSVTIKFDIWLLKIKGATLQRKLVVLVQGSV